MKVLIFITLLFSFSTIAAGPERVASFDRTTWPEKLNTKAAFDKASRFEIYHFVTALDEQILSNKQEITKFTNIKNVNINAVMEWKKLATKRLLNAFIAACQSSNEQVNLAECNNINSITAIKNNMEAAYLNLPPSFDRWKTSSMAFHKRYLYEQVRLAALFPRITSEILTLDDSEMTGFEMKDREFLLTFDDGPSSKKGKNTGDIINLLNQSGLNAIFFVLGERFATLTQKQSKALYKNQCVGSHGYTHKAHPKYKKWKSSLDDTLTLITDKLDVPSNHIWFRPPYGQRSNEIIDHLKQQNAQGVMLWNIDSQDWNRKLDSKEVTDRTTTIMLLWRKGVILFHDLYAKNIATVNNLHTLGENTALTYVNCNSVAIHTK